MSEPDSPILSYAPAPLRTRWQNIALIIALGSAAIAASFGLALAVDAVYPHRYAAHAFLDITPADGSSVTDLLGMRVVDELRRAPNRPSDVRVEHVPNTKLIHVSALARSPQQAVASVTFWADQALTIRSASGPALTYAQRAVRPMFPTTRLHVRNATFALCMLASCIVVPLVIRKRSRR